MILVLIGAKMATSRWVDVSILTSLAAVLGILVVAILASMRFPRARVTSLER